MTTEFGNFLDVIEMSECAFVHIQYNLAGFRYTYFYVAPIP